MKRPDNTEMDRLLRRHARLGGGAVRGSAAAGDGGAHMDADEMNAYAEGALPEAARSRYFAHLADCDSCRKLVTELTLAATASAEGRERAAVAAVPAPSKSWRERLAAFFSPQVLRFAVPALALFAVVIVAIVAMRANREPSSVALNEQNARTSAPAGGATANSAVQQASKETIENHGDGNANAPAISDKQAEPQPAVTKAATDAPAPSDDRSVVTDGIPAPQATPLSSTTVGQANETKAPAREADEQPTGGRRGQEEVQVASAPPPPLPRPAQEPVLAAPSATGETSMRDKQDQKKTKDDDGEDISTGTVAKRAETNKERRDAGKAEGAGTTMGRSRAPVARKVGPGGAGAATESAAATRTVNGRHFQRQGGAWVDTAYNPSRPTTNVRRSSEQYRTLVADEPDLR
ncbi:MAG TPA: zf-HC2 domain-containing protein, partial [Pyrinomonadaceae bacterium]|nr:zf-HC2 domain-containing protein [Pyrinomonadaceae bacterium]